MASGPLTKFNSFSEALGKKVHNLSTDSLKVMLTNNAPSLTWTQKSNVTGEVSSGGGYTTGGLTLTAVTYTQVGGVSTLAADDAIWTGSGGGFGPFRYAIVYNDSASNKELIGYYDVGGELSVGAAATFNINFTDSNGVLDVQ